VKASPLGASTLFLFIKPPSLEALEKRLQGRGTDDMATVHTRLANAAGELSAAEDSTFVDHVIVNADLDAAYAELCSLVSSHVGAPVVPWGKGVAEGAPGAKEYLEGTVVPALREALVSLNVHRPADPLQFLIDKLEAVKSTRAAPKLKPGML
jgi:hypothetical protein